MEKREKILPNPSGLDRLVLKAESPRPSKGEFDSKACQVPPGVTCEFSFARPWCEAKKQGRVSDLLAPAPPLPSDREHRHLHAQEWTAATVDSTLERGDLKDWRELFQAVRQNQEVAQLVLNVASAHDLGGASILAKALVRRMNTHLDKLTVPPA